MKRLKCLFRRLVPAMLEESVRGDGNEGSAEGAVAMECHGSSEEEIGIADVVENIPRQLMDLDEHEQKLLLSIEEGMGLGECLLSAAASGDVNTMDQLCNAGVDINYQGVSGVTAVYLACEHAHFPVLHHLVSRPDCDLNSANSNGWTCLHVAAALGHTALVEYLLHVLSSPDQVLQGVSRGLANQEDLDQRLPLHVAADAGHADIVQHLIPFTQDINKRDFDGATALVLAAGHGMLSSVKALTSAGCDLDERDHEGRTALAEAVSHRHGAVAQHLISWGCRLNVMDVHGYTVLAEAVAMEQVEMVKILIDAGVDVSVQDFCGRTPLHVAILYGYKEISHRLIEANCDVNLADGYGYTPVFMAAWDPWRRDTLSILEHLAYIGADLNTADGLGISPLEKAVHNEEYVRTLIQYGCDVNRSASPYTAIELAAHDNRFDIVDMLLMAGFDVRQVDFSKERDSYQMRYAQLQQVCQSPLRLKDICRLSIRSAMHKQSIFQDIGKLLLPPILKRFLLFEIH